LPATIWSPASVAVLLVLGLCDQAITDYVVNALRPSSDA
jgi:hypothetical protein